MSRNTNSAKSPWGGNRIRLASWCSFECRVNGVFRRGGVSVARYDGPEMGRLDSVTRDTAGPPTGGRRAASGAIWNVDLRLGLLGESWRRAAWRRDRR